MTHLFGYIVIRRFGIGRQRRRDKWRLCCTLRWKRETKRSALFPTDGMPVPGSTAGMVFSPSAGVCRQRSEREPKGLEICFTVLSARPNRLASTSHCHHRYRFNLGRPLPLHQDGQHYSNLQGKRLTIALNIAICPEPRCSDKSMVAAPFHLFIFFRFYSPLCLFLKPSASLARLSFIY